MALFRMGVRIAVYRGHRPLRRGRTGLPDMFLLATFVWALTFFFLSARARRPLLALLAALASGVLLGNLVATKWIGIGAIALVWLWIGLSATLGSAALLPRIRWWLYPIMFLLVPALTYLLWTVPVVGIPGSVSAAVGEALFETPCTFGRTPNPAVQGPTTWLSRVRHWHCTVWNYHAYLTATHPYGSPWWSWPLLKHPVLFHLDTSVDPPRRISATGNPIVWWTGFAAVLLTLLSLPVRYWRVLGVSRRGVEPPSGQGSEQQRGERGGESQRGESRWDSPASLPRDTSALHSLFLDLWLVLGVLGFWLPWVFIQRVAFHYHYFLSFTLTVVLLALWLARLLERPAFRLAVFGFLLAAAVGFVYLYPSATATSAFWLR
ncbi:MAG: hypothetical protein G01um101438_1014 [Parcubacteria group bacterium Gr01-1014_38]|nr:MAG: hypothetical protein G01um101438_1014 [Parcubacteria group bacterium Gr01-1014_38]